MATTDRGATWAGKGGRVDDLRTVARFDLVRLAHDLCQAGRHPELVKAIERAAAAGSIRDDLRTASASLDHIVKLQTAAELGGEVTVRTGEVVVTGALFVQAVVLYARATASKASRPKLLGEAKLSPKERATHVEAMELRNQCIAHFGRGDTLSSGPMFKEAVLFSLLVVDGRPKKQVSVFSTRAQHKVAFAARLSTLIATRLAEVAARTQPLFDAVDRELEAAGQVDHALRGELGQYEFDVEGFAGSAEAAAVLRVQLEAGDVTEMDYALMVPKP